MNKKQFGFSVFLIILFCNFLNLHADLKKVTPKYRHSRLSQKRLIVTADYDFNKINESLSRRVATHTDTVRVLAIRVQFVEDNSRFTTGNGRFDYSNDDTYFINKPPHNKTYFENQMKALSNYFENVSNGKLILDSDIYPADPESAYTLNQSMLYYSPNTTDEELDQRLSELMRDSFLAANEDDAINFTRYDAFIIFHAGVGADFTFDLESTPNDIPSVFLNLNDLKNTIGKDDPDFEGIVVDNTVITEASILPETQCQMGYDIGLLGTAAIMFGHQIGLPNLYDSDTGRPGIGVFGLMDQGSANFLGLLPAQPCAWSKVFLGWEEPIVLSTGTDIPVATAVAGNPATIYKIPIDAKEYYLIENRQQHALRSVKTTVGYDDLGNRIEFKVRDDGTFEITPSSNDGNIGVITDIEEYDFGLPGSGILIWHIDESVIEEKFEENRVNTDIDHRGVDLVEADGAQDIGRFFNFFGILGYESGYEWDMWWKSNEANLAINESNVVEFTPVSIPASISYSKANTHVMITNFSESDSIMTFDLLYDLYARNFPVKIGAETRTNSILSGNISGDENDEFIVCAVNGDVFAWDVEGTQVIENSDSTTLYDLKGDPYKINLALFSQLNTNVSHTPVLGNMDQDAYLELVVVADNGDVYIYDGEDMDSDGRADLISSNEIGESISTNPVVSYLGNDISIIVGHTSGTVSALDADATILWQYSDMSSTVTGIAAMDESSNSSLVVTYASGDIVVLSSDGEQVAHTTTTGADLKSPVVGDIDDNGQSDIVTLDAKGNFYIFTPATSSLNQFRIHDTVENVSNPVVADIDGDQYAEIIVQAAEKVYAFNHNGTLLDNFPVKLLSQMSHVLTEPIIADVTDNGMYEIIISSDAGDLYVVNVDGEIESDYPLALSAGMLSTASIADFNHDENLDIAFIGADGYVYNLNLSANVNENSVLWGGFRNDSQNRGIMRTYMGENPANTDLMPASSVYNYPNPTEGNFTTIRYYLGQTADVSIRIYDMAGELVKDLNVKGIPGTHNEYELDLTNIQSGVYLARVEATGSNDNNVAFFKMAVVK